VCERKRERREGRRWAGGRHAWERERERLSARSHPPSTSPPHRAVRQLSRAHGPDLGPGGDGEDGEGDVVGLEEGLLFFG